MRKISLLSIDLAKNVFQLHGVDANGDVVLRKAFKRTPLQEFVLRLDPCIIAMEACGSSHYWARRFREMGHEVKLIAPKFVKPFVKSNKNDSNDAEAIGVAAWQKSMRFVPIKEEWQQEIQALHRLRELLIKTRISFSNSLMGLAAEFGVVLSKGGTCAGLIKRTRTALEECTIGAIGKRALEGMLEQVVELQGKLIEIDKEIERLARSREDCRRLQQIEGIGPLTATAIVGSTQAKSFKNGRCFAASLGLVPRQHSTGGRNMLLGISKRGNSSVRTFLINGARSAIINSKKEGRNQLWAREKKEKIGMNKACVALANKNARVIWALLAKGEDYRAA